MFQARTALLARDKREMNHAAIARSALAEPLSIPLDADVGHWFAAYTMARHEKKVALFLEMQGFRHYLPTYCSRRKWKNGLTPEIALPLFPNYIFVRLSGNRRAAVLATPGVIHIVGGKEPTPMLDYEIELLRNEVQARVVEPHPYLTEGTRVRILRGALAGLGGVIERTKGHSRVVITLTGIMRSIAVEVAEEEIGAVS